MEQEFFRQRLDILTLVTRRLCSFGYFGTQRINKCQAKNFNSWLPPWVRSLVEGDAGHDEFQHMFVPKYSVRWSHAIVIRAVIGTKANAMNWMKYLYRPPPSVLCVIWSKRIACSPQPNKIGLILKSSVMLIQNKETVILLPCNGLRIT